MPRSPRPRQPAGLTDPKFIIKHGDKYYVTTSVLEYDPAHPTATAEQRAGVASIAAAHRDGKKIEAVHAPEPHMTAHMQTNPSPPR
jgi:hypothetical protein